MTKLVPLLLEWDTRHATSFVPRDFRGGSNLALLETAEQYGSLFLPIGIDRDSKIGLMHDESGASWR